MLRLAILTICLGCASTLQVTTVYDPETGNQICKARVSSRIVGTGETEMSATNACAGQVSYSTRDTGISERAKELGILGIEKAAQQARPGAQLEGAVSELLQDE